MREFLEMVGVQWESLPIAAQIPIALVTLSITLFGSWKTAIYTRRGSWATAKGLWKGVVWTVSTACAAPGRVRNWWSTPRIDPHVQLLNHLSQLQAKIDSLDREIRGS